MVYPPADGRKEVLCAVPPNPPRAVPEFTVGVEARALPVNAAEWAGFACAVLVPLDPQLGSR
jgi:hypothetical protein